MTDRIASIKDRIAALARKAANARRQASLDRAARLRAKGVHVPSAASRIALGPRGERTPDR